MPLNSKITTTNRPVTANGKHRFHKVTQPLPPDYPRQARAATLRQLSTWKSALRPPGDAAVQPPGPIGVGRLQILRAPQARVAETRFGSGIRRHQFKPVEEPLHLGLGPQVQVLGRDV